MKLIIPVLLVLAGCHDRRPPAPTAEQNRQLDEAERMLDDQAKEKGPAVNAADPSANQQ